MTSPSTAVDRPGLRRALAATWPWLTDPQHGPTSVDAGECDRCGAEPRVVATCGPVAWRALGRRCAVAVGEDAWCDGHTEDGEAARAWALALPDEADAVVRLWWVATGEVRVDRAGIDVLRDGLGLPPAAVAALGPG